MSHFSGVLQLTDLDDFITPSQECIKPVKIDKVATVSGTGSRIKVQTDGSYVQLREGGGSEKLQRVDISLNDCLACSGCITSAESVLITQQSKDEMMRVFNEKKLMVSSGKEESYKYIVVSIAVQPVLSLAEKYRMTPEVAFKKLTGYFNRLGADMVLDMCIAEDIVLLEAQDEFIERYRTRSSGVKTSLPMLASACPGWVCYAEKTHGSYILPYISVTKSPQQVIGSMVKNHLAQQMNRPPQNVYHITVMPCFDKKLEASRNDFYSPETDSKDVDCVITSIELEQLLVNQRMDLSEEEEAEPSWPWDRDASLPPHPPLRRHIGSGSGGYAHHIFLHAVKELFPHLSPPSLLFTSLRNQDFQQVTLENDGKVLLRFGIANGFRNIQNLVQKLKRGKCVYDYVEIMACPSGCLNGGAQLRPMDGTLPRELTTKLEKLYQELPLAEPQQNKTVQILYDKWLGGKHSDKKKFMLNTLYHAVEKSSNMLNIKW